MASLRIYFVRHGEAGDKRKWSGLDTERPLSEHGVETSRETAEHFARIMPKAPDVVLTSPLVRARQTAEIAAGAWDAPGMVTVDKRLDHGFDTAGLRKILSEHRDSTAIVLVGHEPSMSRVIVDVIGGGALELKKGGVACVLVTSRVKARGRLQFLVTPEVLACE